MVGESNYDKEPSPKGKGANEENDIDIAEGGASHISEDEDITENIPSPISFVHITNASLLKVNKFCHDFLLVMIFITPEGSVDLDFAHYFNQTATLHEKNIACVLLRHMGNVFQQWRGHNPYIFPYEHEFINQEEQDEGLHFTLLEAMYNFTPNGVFNY